MSAKTHSDFIPPWQDMPTLCAHICATPNTVDSWVKEGLLPQPRRVKGKQMWKWAEVDEYLANGGARAPDALAERIRDATRREKAESRAGH
jgi:predicted DNA-binding transcriptional regulator AlpA